MSAEAELQEFLQDYARLDGADAAVHAKRFLDVYAHELAEKIRNEPSPRDPDDFCGLVDMGADWAADLIDPEVLNSGEGEAVRPA